MTQDNHDMPDDEQLSALYRKTGQEQPPAHLDEAIIGAAQREHNSHPHPAYSPFSRNWRVPVSLAAVLVLSISLVYLMNDTSNSVNETTLLQHPGSTPPPVPAVSTPSEDLPDTIASKEVMPSLRKQEQPETSRDSTAELKKSPATPASRSKLPSTAGETDAVTTQQGIIAGQAATGKADDVPTGSSQPQPLSSPGRQKLAEVPTPLPTVNEIRALREAGNIEAANRAADTFLAHHFGKDLDKVDARQVKLHVREWVAMIIELRRLHRQQEADKLDKMLSGRRRQAPR